LKRDAGAVARARHAEVKAANAAGAHGDLGTGNVKRIDPLLRRARLSDPPANPDVRSHHQAAPTASRGPRARVLSYA